MVWVHRSPTHTHTHTHKRRRARWWDTCRCQRRSQRVNEVVGTMKNMRSSTHKASSPSMVMIELDARFSDFKSVNCVSPSIRPIRLPERSRCSRLRHRWAVRPAVPPPNEPHGRHVRTTLECHIHVHPKPITPRRMPLQRASAEKNLRQ
jgi:hypothetical protein